MALLHFLKGGQHTPVGALNSLPVHASPESEGIPASTGDVHAPAANVAAVVTFAAVADQRHTVSGIAWSYVGGTPAGGSLTIEDGAGNVVLQFDIAAAGPGHITFPVPKSGTAGRAMIITLAAGGVGVTGKVSVLGHWTT